MRDFIDKYFTLLLWPLVVVILTWASWVIVTGREEIPPQAIETNTNGQVTEIPPAIVDQPILEEVSADGAVRWTLYLDRIIREEGSVMELASPRALYRFESGEVLEVTGEAGTYDEEAGILDLGGNVEGHARLAQFEFYVERMVWDSNAVLLTASGGVEIRRGGILFNGEELVLNLADGFARMEVNGGVAGVRVTSSTAELQNISGLD